MADYTDPKLRERLKARIQKSDKGGRPGQWSARKAQLLAQAYKKEGGGYRGKKDGRGKSLDKWGKERWTTADGGRARRPGGTTRYLPEKAWERLTDEEKKATEKAKRKGSQDGDQFVANTPAAKRARKKIAKATKTRKKKTAKKQTSRKKTSKKKTAKKKTSKKKTAKKGAQKKTPRKTAGRKKGARKAGGKKRASKKKTAKR